MLTVVTSDLDGPRPPRQLRWQVAVFLLLCTTLFLADNFINIGRKVEELTKFYMVGRLSPFDFALALLFGWAAIQWGALKRYLGRPAVVVTGGLLALSFLFGLARGEKNGVWLFADVHVFAALFAGVIFGAVMAKTGQFLRLLALLTLVGTTFLVYAGASTDVYKDAVLAGFGTTRVTDPNVYYYWEFLLVPCAILGVRRAQTGWLEVFAFWASFSAMIYFGVLVSATRSCLYSTIILSMLLLLVKFRRRQQTIKGFKATVIVCAITGVAAVGYYVARSFFTRSEMGNVAQPVVALDTELGSLALVERIKGTREAEENLNARGREVRELFKEFQGTDYALGKGLGASIRAEDEFGVETVNSLHVSIFNYLLKFGATGFLAVIGITMIYWPALFLRALLGGESNRRAKASLLCYPGAATAVSLMCMSGGYTVPMYFSLGILYALYVDLRTQPKDHAGDAQASPSGRADDRRDDRTQKREGSRRRRSHSESRREPTRDDS